MEKAKCDEHAILIPYPGQGHITPMLKLAKILHHRGFHITFVNTELYHRRLFRSGGGISSILDGSPRFRFVTIPNELEYEDDDAISSVDLATLMNAIKTNLSAPFRDLAFRLKNGGGGVAAADDDDNGCPPISCIVADGFMSFTLDVAEELGIPSAVLWPLSACAVLVCAHLRQLIHQGFKPPKDADFMSNGYLDTQLDSIPGLDGMKIKHLTSIITTNDPADIMLDIGIEDTERSHNKGSIVVINTAEETEAKTIEVLKSMVPQICSIGPLPLLEDQLHPKTVEFHRLSIFPEDDKCLKWLDSKESGSVILVAFGTTSYTTAEQLIEFAWGLANSKQNFLWIVRPDMVFGKSAVLPPEFEVDIKEDGRGFVADWCNQKAVLKHPAIGGFLTHCGWNSMLESLCEGVPMICWPTVGDQSSNCWFCCHQLGAGLELDSGGIERENIKNLVRELLVSEKGKELKKKALGWKAMAEEACTLSGSSSQNVDRMVDVLASKIAIASFATQSLLLAAIATASFVKHSLFLSSQILYVCI